MVYTLPYANEDENGNSQGECKRCKFWEYVNEDNLCYECAKLLELTDENDLEDELDLECDTI
jgi:hypothetical protein